VVQTEVRPAEADRAFPGTELDYRELDKQTKQVDTTR
jgi:hypothetical protein